jgi:hypothetical protein
MQNDFYVISQSEWEKRLLMSCSSTYLFVCLSVRMGERDSHWKDIREISLLLKSAETFRFWSKSNKNCRHFTYRSAHLCNNITPWLVFIIEICCVLCEIQIQLIDVTIVNVLWQVSLFKKYRILSFVSLFLCKT